MSVTIYTTNTCPWCDKTKEYLRANGVSYNEINVAKNKEAAMAMIQKSGQRAVPVLDVDGSIIIGFDKSRLDKLFNIR
ncbi:MAG: glutaredoxin-like protein YruB-family [Clostridia bacterium]|jgi:glutaredoxin-like YruB-family protein|nr:glutaredoxin-like protein YruB-family [Clostridia bacterium]